MRKVVLVPCRKVVAMVDRVLVVFHQVVVAVPWRILVHHCVHDGP